MTAPGTRGRAFVYGDNVDTDMLAPGLYMKFGIAEIAKHCLEAIDPDFAKTVRPGDVVVGGENFGMGSSREQAVMALRELGVERMPVILPADPAAARLWLMGGWNRAAALIAPYASGLTRLD